jgi:hypothetical protein
MTFGENGNNVDYMRVDVETALPGNKIRLDSELVGVVVVLVGRSKLLVFFCVVDAALL